MFKLNIFGAILDFVNSVPDESFNKSFILDFQPEFLEALSPLKRLVSGGALLLLLLLLLLSSSSSSSYVSNKVKFSLTFISEDATGLKFNHTHVSFISNSTAKFSKFY